jgi:two-component system phosphate regulon sensor histidine kinase PhoR
MKVRSLRWRIILSPLLVVLIGTLIFNAVFLQQIEQERLESAETLLLTETELLVELARIQWEEKTRDDWAAFADRWAQDLGADILIMDRRLRPIATSPGAAELDNPQIRQEILLADQVGIAASLVTQTEDQVPRIYAAGIVLKDGDPIGYIYVTKTLSDIASHFQYVRSITWITAAVIILLILIPLYLVTTNSGQRLSQIAKLADQIASGNREVQITTGIRDEIGDVASALNQLAIRINSQFNEIELEQAKINAVLDQMNEGVMILDQHGSITLANPAVIDLFNLQGQEVISQRLVRVIRNHQVVELWQEFALSGQEQAALIELAETNKLVQVSLTSLNESMSNYSLIVFQDLTQLRQLQTIRRDFISNISHELRTPLASLKALAETLQISALEDPKAARRFLARMDIEIEALAQMVGELLELTRIESGQVPLELKQIDANTVLEAAVERLLVQAERADISLKVRPVDEPNYILADQPRLEQVLVNILHNAIKFTEKGGRIRCGIEAQPDTITFSIEDSGRGIPGEDLPRIFERFYKSRRPKQGSGTGLGLSIAKHLVEAHGGQIWAESQLGKGSTFFIRFPRETA